jgi:N-acetylglucosaminyldiphosphoundecaprenol N-acetyl-beta-D-mannosaminyltransferase
MAQTLQECEKLILKRNSQHVVLNASKVVSAHTDPKLAEIINGCDLVNADGMSVVWAARLLGISVPERVTGIDLMQNLVDMSAQKGYSVYLLGATEATLVATSANFVSRGANIVGSRNGYWAASEEEGIVASVANLRPDVLFLAIPSPNKEVFLSKHLGSLNSGLVVGVGGSFDVVAGLTKRAPRVIQNLGLEWLYRLAQEPKRMFKRYLLGNSKFVLIVLRELARKYRKSLRKTK